MKSSAAVFFTLFLALSLSWAGFVLTPQLQLGRKVQAKTIPGEMAYPIARSGLAMRGAEIYRSQGCVYCHSQQVRQDGARCEVFLTDVGTNTTAVANVLRQFNTAATVQPGRIAQTADVPSADPMVKALRDAGAKAEVKVIPTGPDIARGWGLRRSVAQDYLLDYPVQPGTRRSGPDLSNVGLGKPADWQLLHLYAPKSVVKDSTMPPYPFLFETRKAGLTPSPEALKLPEGYAPPAGHEILPTDDAYALVAYLTSLRTDAPLYEAPVTIAQAVPVAAVTNSPAK